MEISALKEELVNLTLGSKLQAETQREILLILKGNVNAGMDGLVRAFELLSNAVEQMTSEVAHLMRFKKRIEESIQLEKQREQEDRARAQRRKEERAGKVLNIVFGSIGTLVLIVEFILKVMEQLSK